MAAAERTRSFGTLWLLLVSGSALLLEPALRNVTFLGVLVLLLVGWALLAGGANSGADTDNTSASPNVPEANTAALIETGKTLVQCGDAVSRQIDVSRSELVRVQQIFSGATTTLLNSFNAVNETLLQVHVHAENLQPLSCPQKIVDIAPAGDGSQSSNRAITEKTIALNALAHRIDTEMQQVLGMLGEIDGISKQTNLLALNAAIETALTAEAAELKHIARAMGSSINEAIMALQFQDMVAQLIDHVSGQLESLQGLAGAMGEIGWLLERAAGGVSPGLYASLQVQLASTLAMLEGMQQGTEKNPVKQHGFASGDIELF